MEALPKNYKYLILMFNNPRFIIKVPNGPVQIHTFTCKSVMTFCGKTPPKKS